MSANTVPFDTGVYACFDLSGIRGLSPTQFRIYKDAWTTYNTVQSYNSNISTLRHAGNKSLFYYQYVNSAEMAQYKQGQMLHSQIFPNKSWTSVPPD
jgi:hypothetical protein